MFSTFVGNSTVFFATSTLSDEQSGTLWAAVRPAGAADKKHDYPFIYSRGHKGSSWDTSVKGRGYGAVSRLRSSTGELGTVNCAAQACNVQRRLATATRLATSVENRVLILKVIICRSYCSLRLFELASWTEQQLRYLQKQFLWHHSTSMEASHHKIDPALLHTSKQAGGAGLASIHIACKTQRM